MDILIRSSLARAFFEKNLFIYLFLLCWVFIALQGFSLVVVHGLLIVVASLVA